MTATTANLVNPVDGPFIRFPPFPIAPAGVRIMPFKEFTERGIRIEAGADDAEVDALGIPTIVIGRKGHATDECKTNTKRKRDAEESVKSKKKGAIRKGWAESWKESELLRFSTSVNPNSTPFEKLQAAAADFTSGRTWPTNFASETGPRFIWDKFQRYIGIPESASAPVKNTRTPENVDGEADGNISDDEGMEEDAENEGDAKTSNIMTGIIKSADLPATLARQKQEIDNEEKMHTFFCNPEKSIRVFMSSYSRTMGYIWSDVNLECMPRLLTFFVEFLLHNKVLPTYERDLRSALKVITIAQKELPNMSALAKATPDQLSVSFLNCWGKKADTYSVNIPMPSVDEPVDTDASIKDLSAETEEHTAQPDATVWGNPSTGNESSGWGASETPNTWGATAEDVAEGSSWGELVPESVDPAEGGADDLASWFGTTPPETLLTLLGPTALPLTHTTGIVERSMRIIKKIEPPQINPPKSSPQGEGVCEPDYEGVEADLDRLFTKVIMSPKIDWDGGDSPVYSRPAILKTSQGLVVDPASPPPERDAGDGSAVVAPAEGTAKPYDPVRDDITLLVLATPEKVELLSVGMGLGGTWVQIVRQAEGGLKKKKKKGKSKKAVPSYWYIDELPIIIPSFWTVPGVPDPVPA